MPTSTVWISVGVLLSRWNPNAIAASTTAPLAPLATRTTVSSGTRVESTPRKKTRLRRAIAAKSRTPSSDSVDRVASV